ncbi:hypothetical protein [Streptomyces sp. NPDC002580]|uniref:hypothetical protein n=1 Tax=Streptomyces sp. NPDC002580 TaxID=3364653 RepID=UPI0036AAAB87
MTSSAPRRLTEARVRRAGAVAGILAREGLAAFRAATAAQLDEGDARGVRSA